MANSACESPAARFDYKARAAPYLRVFQRSRFRALNAKQLIPALRRHGLSSEETRNSRANGFFDSKGENECQRMKVNGLSINPCVFTFSRNGNEKLYADHVKITKIEQ